MKWFESSKKGMIAGIVVAGLAYGAGWGVAGVIGPMLGGMVADKTGAYSNGFIVAGVFLIIATLLVSTMKSPKAKPVEVKEPQLSPIS